MYHTILPRGTHRYLGASAHAHTHSCIHSHAINQATFSGQEAGQMVHWQRAEHTDGAPSCPCPHPSPDPISIPISIPISPPIPIPILYTQLSPSSLKYLGQVRHGEALPVSGAH